MTFRNITVAVVFYIAVVLLIARVLFFKFDDDDLVDDEPVVKVPVRLEGVSPDGEPTWMLTTGLVQSNSVMCWIEDNKPGVQWTTIMFSVDGQHQSCPVNVPVVVFPKHRSKKTVTVVASHSTVQR